MNTFCRETVCCGTVFRGRFNEIMVVQNYLKPCGNRLAFCQLVANRRQAELIETTTNKLYSDSSSDSGYDESSNQGTILETVFRKDQVSIENLRKHSKQN